MLVLLPCLLASHSLSFPMAFLVCAKQCFFLASALLLLCHVCSSFVMPAFIQSGPKRSQNSIDSGRRSSSSRCEGERQWNTQRRRPRCVLQARMDRGEAELQDIPDVLKTQAIFLREDETGDTIECRPQQIASIQGKKYLIAVPKDVAVAIAMVADEDYIPVPPDDELMGYLFPLVADDCKEAGLTLKRTPACLTLEGLPEDHPEEDVEDVDEDEEGEEVSLIAQFALEDDEVALVKYLTPRMLLCEGPVKGEENVYRLLGPEEEMDVMMEVETIMDQRFEEMGEELKT